MLVVLDNYISRGTDVFLTCKQPDYLASVNKVRLHLCDTQHEVITVRACTSFLSQWGASTACDPAT